MTNQAAASGLPERAAALCLSDLPDDLLCHILSFAPIKEAASTSALARRWRTLWLLSGALNLDSRYSNGGCRFKLCPIFQPEGKAAMAAYSSSCFLKKLTFYYKEDDDGERNDSYKYDPSAALYKEEILWTIRSQLNDLLRSPAARHVEELYFGISYKGEMCSFRITNLPTFKALRVLHITNCIDNNCPKDRVAFPRLTELRLHRCRIAPKVLQAIIHASPLLNTLQLDGGSWCCESQHSLSLPKVTILLLENFYYRNRAGQSILELDAPNLRCFTYKGPVGSLLLKSPVPHITRVELHFDVSVIHRRDVACQFFWQFVSNFNGAKMVMLRFQPLRVVCHHTPGPGDVCK